MADEPARRPMRARDTSQPQRAATPLGLLFGLVSVIAIAADHAGKGLVAFAAAVDPMDLDAVAGSYALVGTIASRYFS